MLSVWLSIERLVLAAMVSIERLVLAVSPAIERMLLVASALVRAPALFMKVKFAWLRVAICDCI